MIIQTIASILRLSSVHHVSKTKASNVEWFLSRASMLVIFYCQKGFPDARSIGSLLHIHHADSTVYASRWNSWKSLWHPQWKSPSQFWKHDFIATPPQQAKSGFVWSVSPSSPIWYHHILNRRDQKWSQEVLNPTWPTSSRFDRNHWKKYIHQIKCVKKMFFNRGKRHWRSWHNL